MTLTSSVVVNTKYDLNKTVITRVHNYWLVISFYLLLCDFFHWQRNKFDVNCYNRELISC